MFAYPTNQHSQFPITLPPVEEFGRPLWAYNHLGWDLLRRLLFGETQALMREIASFGDKPISSRQLEDIVRFYKVHDTVRYILTQACADQPASVVHNFYAEWEEMTFNHYLSQIKKRGR